MLRTKIVSSEELPEEAKIFLGEVSDTDYATYLLVYHNNRLVRCESDSMEPEDAVFYRDMAWISSAITEAYYMGKEDSEEI